MGLAAITAAAAQLAATSGDHQKAPLHLADSSPSRTRPRSRSRSLLSDSTDPDPDDLCESDDTSLPSPTIKTRPAPNHSQSPAKKRRAVSPAPTKEASPSTSSVSPSSSNVDAPAVGAVTGKATAAASQAQADSFPAEMLLDLAGSTSAEVRRMNEDERALVHYKRRLRNRESAKRSRARRQATIHDIQGELEDLRDVTAKLLDRCVSFARVNDRQSRELETLRKEKHLLESMLREGSGSVL